ncbi:tol-pal system protein YbgF [Aliishimia ponticola]|uniref:Cell division coordinator CpoB n=1 Tax=Aliishimia ponticola TaxID=2499833 RepID=A0A4S4NH41_9RHOB|nr:tol-pal system protein YbgF [Aliishimia ponticola]
MRFAIAFSLLAAPVLAQDDRAQSLADIRQEMTVLWVEVQKLKQELNTTQGASSVATQGSALDRLAAIESEVQRLTAKAEEMEFRIDRVVTDGTNRIADLEFRLCELETGCDIATLGDTPTLGGASEAGAAAPAPTPVPLPESGPQFAATEEADFQRAEDALAEGDYTTAAKLYATFNQTYPGGPLAAAAEMGRGEALEQLGDTREAARAFLAAFSANQTGPEAPMALVRLGAALGQLGQTNEACVTLSEVSVRYPGAVDAISDAQSARAAIGCS